ncbi:MAG: cytochrome c biogenesis protein DipZ [Patescibacteria group bacterium]
MILLILFAFIAGFVTILSPCILPILPVVLSGSVAGGKRRPIGIVLGFISSFTFFTLTLSSIIRATNIPAEALRLVSVVVIIGFGLSLLIPKAQVLIELIFSRLSAFLPRSNTNSGLMGGFLVGVSLGLIWTPCVGPILASVISLALTGLVNGSTILITLSYSFGTAIPMFAITYGGKELLNRNQWLLKNTVNIQKTFGVLMIVTGIAILTNQDRKFQAFILEKFPNYGVGLTKFEENKLVNEALGKLKGNPNSNNLGKSLDTVVKEKYFQAPEIIPGGVWLNSQELKLSELRGKVVLIDFWTYSCINCIRTLPYLKEWHSKYKDKGLVIIGVHSPEFEFEKNVANLKKAVSDFGITYPVVQDNNFATWRAYNNRYWPAKYFIDKEGKIRGTHFGEGEYDVSEKLIQKLLREINPSVVDMPVRNEEYQVYADTPELYLGFKRIEYFSSPEKIEQNIEKNYTYPLTQKKNTVAFKGSYVVKAEYSNSAKGGLRLNFNSKNVYLVMKPKAEGVVGEVKVYLDGVLVTNQNSGDDVSNGLVSVSENRLYTLINLGEPGEHTLELEFLDQNTLIFAFTFG